MIVYEVISMCLICNRSKVRANQNSKIPRRINMVEYVYNDVSFS